MDNIYWFTHTRRRWTGRKVEDEDVYGIVNGDHTDEEAGKDDLMMSDASSR